MADENTDAQFLIRPLDRSGGSTSSVIRLPRASARLAEAASAAAGGLTDRLRNILWAVDCPADKDARPGGGQRLIIVGHGKTVAIQLDTKFAGKFLGLLRHLDTNRQHDHIEGFRLPVAGLIDIAQLEVAGLRILENPADHGPDVAHLVLLGPG